MPTIQILVLLLAVTAAAAVIAKWLKIPPAIILVLTGVVLALIPGLPAIELARITPRITNYLQYRHFIESLSR
jgi:Kef-type K+ transport system membrane component KefB